MSLHLPRLQPSSVDRLLLPLPPRHAATIVLMRAACHLMHDLQATLAISEAYDRLGAAQ